MNYDISTDDEDMFEDEANKYILFDIDEGKYAMHINYIEEIVSISSITPVPGYPDFARGVVDLRGMTVTIIDFRMILGSGNTQVDKNNYCIITDYNGSHYGILVDKVSDITDFAECGVSPAPKATESYANNFVEGVARADGKIVMILDPTKVFDSEKVSVIMKDN